VEIEKKLSLNNGKTILYSIIDDKYGTSSKNKSGI
jgi:hypothetical protein